MLAEFEAHPGIRPGQAEANRRLHTFLAEWSRAPRAAAGAKAVSLDALATGRLVCDPESVIAVPNNVGGGRFPTSRLVVLVLSGEQSCALLVRSAAD